MEIMSFELADFYKWGHPGQYPEGITRVYSNWTPRYSIDKSDESCIFFGLQYFMLRYLVQHFEENFFEQGIARIVEDYRRISSTCLGIKKPKVDHLEALHAERRLPLRIFALPEGSLLPYKVPAMVWHNTVDHAYWLPNAIETLLSNILWMPSTSATTSRKYRKLLTRHAIESGETDMGYIDLQAHDFSMRGMAGIESAALSGAGHLLYFKGTDTIPAIRLLEKYYFAFAVGCSLPATEHSVMQAGGLDGEFETFKRLVESHDKISIVSDTWDLWKVLTEYVPPLAEYIKDSGKLLVIRPDSGDPVKIMIGDADALNAPVRAGAVELMADAMGTTSEGGLRRKIKNGAVIYGDSITLERADKILRGLREKNLSVSNAVFGVGSYTYQHRTRDNHGWTVKSTETNLGPIWKDPITDGGGKKSAVGIPIVTEEDGLFSMHDHGTESQLNDCAMKMVFNDGYVKHYEAFETIRERAIWGLKW